MKGKIIPDSDHVARYCKPTTVEGDEILAPAFFLRPDEESLSVNWLEYFKLFNREKEISEIQKIYRRKFGRVSSNARIAVVNIGQVKNKVLSESDDGRSLKFKHSPSKEDRSHCEIHNLKPDYEIIAELIISAIDQKNNVYPARK